MTSEHFKKKFLGVLVSKASNFGQEYSLEYRRQWDSQIRQITGGLTIFKKSRGQWISPVSELFNEEMIHVRVFCSKNSLDKILKFTLEHYNQKVVMAYEVSNNIILKYKKQ
jgi:hypothetical protein